MNMILKSLLGTTIITVLHIAAVRTFCQDGWTRFEGSCYHFGHEASTFTEAEHYCKQHGSNLVHVNSQPETLFLRTFLMELKRDKHWIGLTDRDIEGLWKWVDDNETATYSNWYPNEPNQGNDVNCVAIRADFHYQWTDDVCSLKFYPICEQTISLCNHCCGVHWLHNQLVNSADPDETAPAGAVSSGSSLFTGPITLKLLDERAHYVNTATCVIKLNLGKEINP